MLIEQIIEFEFREPGSPCRLRIPKTGYFHHKTKRSKANLGVNYCLLPKILQMAMHLAYPRLGQVTYKI